MQNNILKHTFLFSFFVLFAQVLGLVRDLFLVRFFGVGPILDTYYLAFKIPDMMNIFYSVFLGSVIFIPLLTKARNSGEENVGKEINKVGSLVAVLVILMTLVLFVLMPFLATLIAPAWSGEQLNNLITISRILLLAQIFFPLGILGGAIGMVYNKPLGMAVSGPTYNLFILLGAYFLSPIFGIYGVVYSVVFAAVMFALVQVYPKIVRSFFANFQFKFLIQEWKNFFVQNFGRFISVALNQLYNILLLSFASLAGAGAVTIYYNALNIYMAIFFVLGASLGTAMMPKNSLLHVEEKHDELKTTLENSIVYMFYVSIFVAVVGYLFAKDILHIIFYFSNISSLDLDLMANIFSILVLSIPLFNTLEIARKYMYSVGLILFATIITATFTSIFVFLNLYGNYIGIPVLTVLPWSVFIANLVTVFTILLVLHRKKKLSIWHVLNSLYKPVLSGLLTVFIFVRLTNYYPVMSLFANNFLLDLILNSFYVLVIFLTLSFLLIDKVTKNILLTIRKILLK